MAEETKEEKMAREDKARKDAAEKAERDDAARADAMKRSDEKLDMLLAGIDSIRSDVASCNSRMDAWEKEDKERKDAAEKARKDAAGEDFSEEEKAKRLAADKARRDSEEEEDKKKEKAKADAAEEEKKKADAAKEDAARADSSSAAVIEGLKGQIAELASRIPKQRTDDDYAAMIKVQARADEIFVAHGLRAPQPLPNETELPYRLRCADSLKKHSTKYAKMNLGLLSTDAEAFGLVENEIYADAMLRAREPNDIPAGRIRSVTKSVNGHQITEFFGSDTHFVKGMTRPARKVAGFRMAAN